MQKFFIAYFDISTHLEAFWHLQNLFEGFGKKPIFFYSADVLSDCKANKIICVLLTQDSIERFICIIWFRCLIKNGAAISNNVHIEWDAQSDEIPKKNAFKSAYFWCTERFWYVSWPYVLTLYFHIFASFGANDYYFLYLHKFDLVEHSILLLLSVDKCHNPNTQTNSINSFIERYLNRQIIVVIK